MTFVILVVAWILAVQAVGLRFGLVGLHPFPRRCPRWLWPAAAALAVALAALALRQTEEASWAFAWIAAPLGALTALALATTVRRRPDDRWLAAASSHRSASLRLDDDPGAGALLLTAAAAPSAVVVVLHGGGNDRFFGLSYLFEQLLDRDCAVITAHLAGHGRQGRDRFSLEACRRRADRLVEAARRHFPTARVVLLGQSLGAALALDWVARGRRCDRVVAVSAPATLSLGAALWSELGAFLRPAIYRALRYGNLFEVLPAAGPFKRASYPVRTGGRGYLRAFAGAIRAMDLPRRLQAVVPQTPRVLILHGDRDGVVAPANATLLARSLGSRAHLRRFARVTHLDPLLDRAVVAELVAWLLPEGSPA